MAYVIVVYDVNVERQGKVRGLLKRFLTHVQRSVFEGELTESQIFFLKRELAKLIQNRDSIIIYVLTSKSSIKDRITLGEKEDYQVL